jgi:hypothetical protein
VVWDPETLPHETAIAEMQPASFNIIGEWRAGAKSVYEITFTAVEGGKPTQEILIEPATIKFDPTGPHVKAVEVTVLRKPVGRFEIKTGSDDEHTAFLVHRVTPPLNVARDSCECE